MVVEVVDVVRRIFGAKMSAKCFKTREGLGQFEGRDRSDESEKKTSQSDTAVIFVSVDTEVLRNILFKTRKTQLNPQHPHLFSILSLGDLIYGSAHRTLTARKQSRIPTPFSPISVTLLRNRNISKDHERLSKRNCRDHLG